MSSQAVAICTRCKVWWYVNDDSLEKHKQLHLSIMIFNVVAIKKYTEYKDYIDQRHNKRSPRSIKSLGGNRSKL